MHLANQRPRKPDKLSQGAHNQTSYPRIQWEITLDKRGLQNPRRKPAILKEAGEWKQQQQRGMQGQEQEQEHMTTHAAGS